MQPIAAGPGTPRSAASWAGEHNSTESSLHRLLSAQSQLHSTHFQNATNSHHNPNSTAPSYRAAPMPELQLLHIHNPIPTHPSPPPIAPSVFSKEFLESYMRSRSSGCTTHQIIQSIIESGLEKGAFGHTGTRRGVSDVEVRELLLGLGLLEREIVERGLLAPGRAFGGSATVSASGSNAGAKLIGSPPRPSIPSHPLSSFQQVSTSRTIQPILLAPQLDQIPLLAEQSQIPLLASRPASAPVPTPSTAQRIPHRLIWIESQRVGKDLLTSREGGGMDGRRKREREEREGEGRERERVDWGVEGMGLGRRTSGIERRFSGSSSFTSIGSIAPSSSGPSNGAEFLNTPEAGKDRISSARHISSSKSKDRQSTRPPTPPSSVSPEIRTTKIPIHPLRLPSLVPRKSRVLPTPPHSTSSSGSVSLPSILGGRRTEGSLARNGDGIGLGILSGGIDKWRNEGVQLEEWTAMSLKDGRTAEANQAQKISSEKSTRFRLHEAASHLAQHDSTLDIAEPNRLRTHLLEERLDSAHSEIIKLGERLVEQGQLLEGREQALEKIVERREGEEKERVERRRRVGKVGLGVESDRKKRAEETVARRPEEEEIMERVASKGIL